MNSKHISTASGGGATVTCSVSADLVKEVSDLIERKGGLIAKARAAKHLSQVSLNEISEQLEGPRAKPDGDFIDLRLHKNYIEHLIWLVSEVWEVNQDLSELIDTLHDDFADFADASYAARQATAGAA